jgi:CBS domain containing-hemolysin-like protein
MVAEGATSGAIETEERHMIERVLRLADKPVRALMTPRTELEWIDRTASPQDMAARLRASHVTRFVVADGRVDNVVGVVASKDLLDALQSGEQVKRRKGAGDFDGGIEEQRRTGRAIHWNGLKDTGAQDRPTILMEDLQMQSGRLQEMKALVQVRSERDANPHFNPRTSCMS